MVLEPNFNVMYLLRNPNFQFSFHLTYIHILQGHCNTYTAFVVLQVINSEILNVLLLPVDMNSDKPLIGLFNCKHTLPFLHE